MMTLHANGSSASTAHFAYTYVESTVGKLMLAGDEQALWIVSYTHGAHAVQPSASWRESRSPFREAIRQLEAYFNRELRSFDLALHPVGTDFQVSVWNALRDIPYGKTESYGELAARIGKPAAVRAVGAANGANPIAIVLPCHRVIGSTGKLVGYGGGLQNKVKLLALERGELFV